MKSLNYGKCQMKLISKSCFGFQKIRLYGDAIILSTSLDREELYGINVMETVLFRIVKLLIVVYMTPFDFFATCGTGCSREKV